jgi:two-component system sensor histidine kinase RstB
LRIKPKQKLYWFIAVIVINFVVASLIAYHIKMPLETKIYDDHNLYLLEVQKELHQTLEHSNVTEWQSISLQLEKKYDADSEIISRDKNSLGVDIFERLKSELAHKGLISIETATIYYPLGKNFVLKIGPVPYYNWLVFLADWLSWIVAIAINMAILQAYLKFVARLNNDVYNELASGPIKLSNPKDLYSSVSEMVNYITETHKSSEQRLTLQRDLLHGVAHEFRSPMARIQFALDMQVDADHDEAMRLQKSIQNSLDDLDELVKELLYYVRLKDENSEFDLERVSINDAIYLALEKVTSFYPKINFDYYPNQTLFVQGDLNLLIRLFVNLLRNAGRFAASRCMITSNRDGDEVVIVIEDDGIGIPPGKRDRVFEPFTRLDPSRSRDSGGCGLGLAIVGSIVAKHDGKVEVVGHDKQVHKLSGACFRVTLPCVDTE